jgi:L,D-transpeptidase ErfK/SrfK
MLPTTRFIRGRCFRLLTALPWWIFVLILVVAPSRTSEGFGTSKNPARSRLLGALQFYQISAGTSLIEVARKFDIGFNAIVAANPGVDPWVPAAGSRIVIPTFWILPETTSSRVVINIPELRLYYLSPKGSVRTFPLGIGEQGRETPVGKYKIVGKMVRPRWQVPDSIRRENPKLPRMVPPGPENPLGSHALRLSGQGLLIHGTNRPWGIGRRSSHGCLRLYPEDIVKLYSLVKPGTAVDIVNQPVKACRIGNRIFLEAHRPVSGNASISQAMHLLADMNILGCCDFKKINLVLDGMLGIPTDVTLER